MSGTFHVTLTVEASQAELPDDCEHAVLMGMIRRALENSPEFAQRFGGHLVGLVAEVSDSMRPEPYRSAFRVQSPGLDVMRCDHGCVLCAQCGFIPYEWKDLLR